jgi:uncharacterized protein
MLASRTSDTSGLIPSLLNNGPHSCNPHFHDEDGNTALHHASAAGELKALRLLLQAGASPTAKNSGAWTPIDYSATVAAEVYFKSLVNEVQRGRAGSGTSNRPPVPGTQSPGGGSRRPIAGAVRLVTDESGAGFPEMGPARSSPGREYSPLEATSRRAMTPTQGRNERTEWIGAESGLRARASSGD